MLAFLAMTWPGTAYSDRCIYSKKHGGRICMSVDAWAFCSGRHDDRDRQAKCGKEYMAAEASKAEKLRKYEASFRRSHKNAGEADAIWQFCLDKVGHCRAQKVDFCARKAARYVRGYGSKPNITGC